MKEAGPVRCLPLTNPGANSRHQGSIDHWQGWAGTKTGQPRCTLVRPYPGVAPLVGPRRPIPARHCQGSLDLVLRRRCGSPATGDRASCGQGVQRALVARGVRPPGPTAVWPQGHRRHPQQMSSAGTQQPWPAVAFRVQRGGGGQRESGVHLGDGCPDGGGVLPFVLAEMLGSLRREPPRRGGSVLGRSFWPSGFLGVPYWGDTVRRRS